MFGNTIGELMRRWRFTVDFRKGKIIDAIDYLLEIDREIAEVVDKQYEQ